MVMHQLKNIFYENVDAVCHYLNINQVSFLGDQQLIKYIQSNIQTNSREKSLVQQGYVLNICGLQTSVHTL